MPVDPETIYYGKMDKKKVSKGSSTESTYLFTSQGVITTHDRRIAFNDYFSS